MSRKRVGILVFPDVEVLDFCGPFEVFSTSRLAEARRRQEPSPFEVVLVAQSRETVTATGGLRVIPDHDLDSCPPLEVVVVPGGWGTRALAGNERLIGWIQDQASTVELLCAVCTGAFLLAEAGVLSGRRATTHWLSLDRLQAAYPEVIVEDRMRVVEEDYIFTSAGISAGIDMALRVVARLFGQSVARAAARHMEYPYPDSNERCVPV
jgi:transcriptional regulator GlxA family with amidase domain